MTLTVFSVIRNGIRNGYPFVEAFGSWFEHCDRIIVVDGESADGTQHVLTELARVDERLEWVSRPWPAGGAGGSSIADITNEGLALARPTADRLMYVQADEIYSPDQRALVRATDEGAVEFGGCVNFWNSLATVVAEEFPLTYVRSFPSDARARSTADAYTFEIDAVQVEHVAERILHFGWCFPVNILQKHVSHAALYRDKPAYVERGRLAKLMLDQRVYDRRLLDALLPEYTPKPFEGVLPECMRHLTGRDVYDPYVGLDLLRSGVRW
jgi:glycosyltransferase involved in cell wall biosynthesis